jgi:adenylosuccinate synthase
MPCQIVVGAQWGDEGKGKIVDILSEGADLVVRYQGGANAGHTVWFGGKKYVLHLLPSGALREGKRCLLGNGVVIDPPALFEEMEQVAAAGLSLEGRLGISPAAHVTLPYHKWLEQMEETALGVERIGTAGRAIGPTYRDKSGRLGVRISDLLHPDRLRKRVESRVRMLVDPTGQSAAPGVDVPKVVGEYLEYGRRLAPYVVDVSLELNRALDAGRRVIMEGAQGAMLDLDHGTYPFVTSSSSVTGVAKAYCTRVGNGPFPSEVEGEVGARLREVGAEFGATTGRPRRCGWYDAVAVRHAVRANGLETLGITKLDVLDGISPLKICTAYRVGERVLEEFTYDMEDFEDAVPVYEEWEGWTGSTAGARSWAELPEAARRYLDRLSEVSGAPLCLVSVGKDREETLWLRDIRFPVR